MLVNKQDMLHFYSFTGFKDTFPGMSGFDFSSLTVGTSTSGRNDGAIDYTGPQHRPVLYCLSSNNQIKQKPSEYFNSFEVKVCTRYRRHPGQDPKS